MKSPADIRLRAYPVKVLSAGNGVILKRGCTELHISGQGAGEAVHRILVAIASSQCTKHEISNLFSMPDREAVCSLIDELLSKRILVPHEEIMHPLPQGPEHPLDIFYWHFGQQAPGIVERLAGTRIIILGVNLISCRMATSLAESAFPKVQVVDFPLFRNLRLFDDSGHLLPSHCPGLSPIPYDDWIHTFDEDSPACLVATSDVGRNALFSKWNEYCVDKQFRFLPVVLHNLRGYVGPLVIPGETACYECYRARQNAHIYDPHLDAVVERTAFETQPFIGFHPTMASILGDVASFEIARFHSGISPRWNVGSVIEMDLLTSQVASHKVLKVPRCPICSKRRLPVEITKRITFFNNQRDTPE